MKTLYQSSIEVILAGQAESGAYVASPTFSQYRACWMRDGALIAYSMDCAGQHASATRFFQWANRTLQRHQARIDHVLDLFERHQPLTDSDYLPTRFTLDGELVPGKWGDFQLDGYGTWLWALGAHIEQTGDTAFYTECRTSVEYVCRYLSALWQQPNYDCWEENPEQIHMATLAAVYGGLMAVHRLDPTLNTEPIAAKICEYVLHNGINRIVGTADQHFVKYIGNPAVDSSLLWLAVPYSLVTVNDPLFTQTLTAIERDLHHTDSGVYRYRADVYYGGGEWLLLTAWLGWVYAVKGEPDKARKLLRWIQAQTDTDGLLPEQTSEHLLAPEHFESWVALWGNVAKPLLWSHAMVLILYHALQLKDDSQ